MSTKGDGHVTVPWPEEAHSLAGKGNFQFISNQGLQNSEGTQTSQVSRGCSIEEVTPELLF